MNEATAIRLCLKQRDPRGFEFLVKQYRREAYYHAMGLLGDGAAAEDLCQESFAKAYAAMPRLKSLQAFYPWFYTILKNGCLNHIRARRQEQDYEERADARSDPTLAAEQRDDASAIHAALMKLKPEFREILIMKHLHDSSYEDISKVLQIPRGTVMSRLHHARIAFRDQYMTTIKETHHEHT
ncbi:MAG: RNA polymerase sigma factor [Proteobacteria bacterium]|jgi:RNA polymerase sigma-70 factor, ECF subfamily|nr:RNA polymerase sigma factor [Pseudomonadota bacterium]MDA1298721.1 RNA polymerase sigma factor [Pseudomonadota bacterium]